MSGPQHDAIDIWRLRHTADHGSARLVDLLSPDERARATRYRRTGDGRSFAVARAGLRILLAGYEDVPPAWVRLEQRCRRCGGLHGPIRVRGPGGLRAARVSVSHTKAWTIYAVARRHVVGVDVECDDRDVEVADVARLVLTPAEQRVLHTLPDGQRRHMLLELWTRKEAYLKARETGVLQSPDEIEVLSVEPAADSTAGATWHLHRFSVGDRTHGALAVLGPSCVPRLRTLDLGVAAANRV